MAKQLPLFPEMPQLPYADALLDLERIEQGFTDNQSVKLIQEHRACQQSQILSKAVIAATECEAPTRRSRHIPFADDEGPPPMFPPPSSLPPLI